jgi:hypothetical protein
MPALLQGLVGDHFVTTNQNLQKQREKDTLSLKRQHKASRAEGRQQAIKLEEPNI